MTERQAFALDTLLAEVNDHAPTRSKASDGGRASSSHSKQNPTSDHEPNRADVWTAFDFTHDPTHGLSCSVMASALDKLFGVHPAMGAGSYIIWNGRIKSFNRRSEGWRPYTGSNPHTKHLHLSVSDAATGYDSRRPWNLWRKAPAPTPAKVTRVMQARALLLEAIKHSGPIRARAIKAALALLPKR